MKLITVITVTDAQEGSYEYSIVEANGAKIAFEDGYSNYWYLLSTLKKENGDIYYYATAVALNGSSSNNGSISTFYKIEDWYMDQLIMGNEIAAPSWAVKQGTYEEGDTVTNQIVHVSSDATNYLQIIKGNNNNREAYGNKDVANVYSVTSTSEDGLGTITLTKVSDLKIKTVFKDDKDNEITDTSSLPKDYKLLVKMVRNGETFYTLQDVDTRENPSAESQPVKFYKYSNQTIDTDHPYYYSGNGSETISTQVVTGANGLTADLIQHKVSGAVFYNENTIGGTQNSDLTKDLFSTSSAIASLSGDNVMTTTFTHRKDDGVDHDINVSFYKEHKQDISQAELKTGDNMSTENGAYFFRVRLYNNGKLVGYKIVPVSSAEATAANHTGHFTHTINANDSFQLVDDNGVDIADGVLHYDPTVYTSDVRLYKANNAGQLPANLSEVSNKGTDELDGFDFWQNVPDAANNKTDIALYKAYKKVYQVKIEIEGNVSPSSSDAIGLYVKAAHQTSDPDILELDDVSSVLGWRTETTSDGKTVITYLIEDQTTEPHTYHWTDHGNTELTGNETFTLSLKQDNKNVLSGAPVKIGGEYYTVSYDTGRVERKNIVYDDTNDLTTITHFINLTKAEYDPAATPHTIIGEAAEYGIVANRYEQSGHTETNFAVNELYETANNSINGSGANDIPFWIGKVDTYKLWLESDKNSLYVNMTQSDIDNNIHQEMQARINNAPDRYNLIPTSQSDINNYVNGLIKYGQDQSAALAQKTTIKPNKPSNEKDTLDTTMFPDNITIYVDCENILSEMATTGWEIKKLPGQSIVFNIPGTGTVNIAKMVANIYDPNDPTKLLRSVSTQTSDIANSDGSSEKAKAWNNDIMQHITFNAYDASALNLSTAGGLFLAPKAETVTQKDGAGTILTPGTVVSTAEWHFYNLIRHYKAKGDFTLRGKKAIENAGSQVSLEGFKFGIYAITVDEQGQKTESQNPIETVESDSSGKIEFTKLKFDESQIPEGESREYYYAIREIVPDDADKVSGVTYDADPVFLKVVATDEEESEKITFVIYKGTTADSQTERVSEVIESGESIFNIGSFTNHFEQETGNLKVRKTVSGTGADQNKSFTFSVELSDSTISGVYGGMTFSNGVATFTLKHGQEIEATGLPVGVHYTVTEQSDPDYVSVVTNGEGVITSSDDSQIAEVSIDNKKTNDIHVSTDYTVTKRWEGDDPSNRPDNLIIKLLQDNVQTTYAHTSWVKNEDNTWTCKFENLPVFAPDGHAYSYKAVEETVPTGYVQGDSIIDETHYELDPDISTGDYQIVESCRNTSFEISNFLDLNFLIIKRTHDMRPLIWTQRPIAESEKNMLVKFSHDHIFNEYDAVIDEYEFISGIPVYYYNDEPHETPNTSGRDNMSIQLVGDTVYLKFGTHAEWAQYAKGTYHQKRDYNPGSTTLINKMTGDLELSKVLISDAAADASQKFTFTVTLSDKTISGTYGGMTFTNGVAKVELKGGETATATGLPTGVTYTITEADAPGFTLTSKTGDTGTISTTKSTASFTNTRETGDLKLSKTLVSDAAADANQKFTFTVTLSDTTINKTFGDMTFANGVAKVELKGGESATATGLPTGITYTITETSAPGFTLTSKTGDTGTISTTQSTASFTNTRETGDLDVQKTVVSTTGSDKQKDFDFTVTLSDTTISGTYGEMTFANGVARFTLKDGHTKSATGLPTGITYTVSEETEEGFVTTKTGDTGEITTTKAEAKFTNAKEEGGLIVSKSVVSSMSSDKTRDYDFTVTLSDTTISGTYGEMTFTNGVAHFTLKDGETKSATGLPKNVRYTVEEQTYEDMTTTSTGETGTIRVKDAEGKPVTESAEFVNTKKTGDLELSKTLISDAAADRDQQFTFTVKLSDKTIAGTFGGMTFTDGEATVNLKGGQKATATGLPVGVGYTITEASATGFEQTGKTGDTGTISTAKSTANFTNTRENGELELSKTVVSDAAADANQEFTFTVTLTGLTDAAKNKTYGDMTFADGVATVKLKGGQTATATGLPTGITYTITEANAPGFTLTSKTGDTGIISTTKSSASFTNTRETGDLELSKTLVSDAAADANQEFTFTVTLSDTTINSGIFDPLTRKYGDMNFKDGVATVKLKGGESATATGLPTGITYTITEESAEGFEQTGKTGDTGTISTTKSTASFTNTREAGELEVTKTVVGKDSDKSKSYSFTVTLTGLTDAAKNKTYGDMAFTNGVATFSLSDRESVKATGLPTGITYTVAETDPGEDCKVVKTGDTGTIIKNTKSVAAFKNCFAYGEIQFEGTKKFEHGDISKTPFSFTLYKKNGNELSEVETVTTKADGTFEFTKLEYTLKDLRNGTSFDSEKQFDYVIKEVIPETADEETGYDETNDIQYDTTEYPVTVSVKYDGTAALDVSSDKGVKFDFTNEKKYTELKLTKNVDGYMDSGEKTNATIVFTISYKVKDKDGEYVPVTRTAEVQYKPGDLGDKVTVIRKIPYDLKDLTVTEVYSGIYKPKDATQTPVLKLDKNGIGIYTVTFENEVDNHKYTGGIINKYQKDADGNFKFKESIKDGTGVEETTIPEAADTPSDTQPEENEGNDNN